MEVLDEAVKNVLTLVEQYVRAHPMTATLRQTTALACEIAEDSAVLLQNDGILPLDEKEKLFVCGDLFEKMRYQARGSSMINPTKLTTPKAAFDAMGVRYTYARGYAENSTSTIDALLREALDGAKKFQKVLVFAGLTDYVESEGCDREDKRFPKSARAHRRAYQRRQAGHRRIVRGLARGAGRSRKKSLPFSICICPGRAAAERARVCCSAKQTLRAGLQRLGRSAMRTSLSAKRRKERKTRLQRERLCRLPLLYNGEKAGALSLRLRALLYELCLVGYADKRGRGSVHDLLPREKYGNARRRGSRAALCFCAREQSL